MVIAANAWLLLVNAIFLPAAGCSKWDSIYGKVIYVNVMFRHGIRAPTQIYPHDPNILDTDELWPNGLGELTKEGALQHYHLGMWLRKRYEHLLPPDGKYNRSVIQVLSSDIDRCIMSATANMAGMFPNDADGHLGGLHFPPVPIHTLPKQHDNVIRFSRPCKKYRAELDKFKNTREYQRVMGSNSALFRFAAYMSGFNISVQDPRQFATLYITLYIEEMYGIEHPPWCREIYPDKMDVVGQIFAIPTYTKTLQRLRVGMKYYGDVFHGPTTKLGYLLNCILTTMENKMKDLLDPPTQNLTVYSAHDSTLASLLHTMGVYNFILPPFASAILIELRKVQNREPVVMIFYKNSTSTKESPILLSHPSFGEACSLSYLRELWSPLLIDEESKWEAECEN